MTTTDAETWQDHAVATVLDLDLRKAPVCETIYILHPVPAGCKDEAKFTVRFKAHGCGRGTQLACAGCIEFMKTQALSCVWCATDGVDAPLVVVSVTSL